MKKVLIIEDHFDIRQIVKLLLVREGYEVFEAVNGAEGLATLRAGLNPNLILLDLMMPVMDGFQFGEEIRQDPDLSKIPIVIMSADGHVNNKQSRVKAKAYVKKPVDIEVLLDTIEKWSVV